VRLSVKNISVWLTVFGTLLIGPTFAKANCPNYLMHLRYLEDIQARETFLNDSQTVLRTLLTRSQDGYTLMSTTGFDEFRLKAVIYALRDDGFLIVKGDLPGDKFGEAVTYIPPTQFGRIEEFFRGRYYPNLK
jgi:hypothetical protein